MACSEVKPGDLNRYCKVLTDTKTSDGIGGYTREWTVLGETRIKADFKDSRDHVNGQVLTFAQDAKVTMLSNVPMEELYRIELSDGQQYECMGVSPAEPMSRYKQAFFRRVQNEKAV